MVYLVYAKSGVFSTTLFIAIIAAGLYGVLHDQVTATIAPEYYTRFKFHQFHIDKEMPFRAGVAIVGFYATWWFGALIGLILGAVAFIYPNHISMRIAIIKALYLIFGITLLGGCAGFLYGKYYLAVTGVNWWLPENLEDKEGFVTVGAIRNFSYLGGLTGLISGLVFLILKKNKIKRAISV